MSRSSQLEVENKRLSMKVDEMKQICTTTSSLNVKFRMQLEKESTEKENLHEANLKLKTKLNSMSVICNELNEKVKVLESNLKRQSVTRIQPQVQMINSIADIVVGPKDSEAFDDLQRRYDELDAEHHDALDVIDQLEFELGDVSLPAGQANPSHISCFSLFRFPSDRLPWNGNSTSSEREHEVERNAASGRRRVSNWMLLQMRNAWSCSLCDYWLRMVY